MTSTATTAKLSTGTELSPLRSRPVGDRPTGIHRGWVNSHTQDLMAQQAGIIRVGQLRPNHRWEQIARWVASGELIRLGRDWLQNPSAPTDLSARFARAQLQMSEPVIACSLSAAEFYGFHVVDDGKLLA